MDHVNGTSSPGVPKSTGVEECMTMQICDEVLIFEDIEHYETVYSCLENIYEQYIAAYVELHEDMDEDDYELQVDYDGFDKRPL